MVRTGDWGSGLVLGFGFEGVAVGLKKEK